MFVCALCLYFFVLYSVLKVWLCCCSIASVLLLMLLLFCVACVLCVCYSYVCKVC